MRHTALASGLSCLALLVFGAGHPSRRPTERLTISHPQANLEQMLHQGAHLFASAHYEAAAGLFEAGLRQAQAARDPRLQVLFLNNLAGCRMASFQYGKALEAYLAARKLAEQRSDGRAAAAIWGNLASLYSLMGDTQAAEAAAEQAWRLAEQNPPPDPRLLLRLATIQARRGKLTTAWPLFQRAIRAADEAGDDQAYGQACRTLGYECVQAGWLELAEQMLLEAFRQQRLAKAPDIYLAYRNLALLRMAQGDLRAADRLMEAALAAARARSALVPLWSLYYERGRLRLRQNRLPDALNDFRQALDLARRWRLEALPADNFRISLDTGIQQVYAALTETAATLALRTKRQSLAREAFEAAEENRAAALRALLEQEARSESRLSPAYGEILAELHGLEASLWKRDDPALRARLREVQRQLVELELEAGIRGGGESSFRWEPRGRLLERVQHCLRDDEAFIAFHLGEQASYRWAITRHGFAMARVPGRAEISSLLRSFIEAARGDAVEPSGRRLYQALFGSLDAEFTRKPIWLLALETDLFEAPLAALVVERRQGRPVYLSERHALQVVPNAYWLGSAGELGWDGEFVGLGDPIYNLADERWVGRLRPSAVKSALGLLPPSGQVRRQAELELARLPGSGREVRACAAHWSQTRLLEGEQASLERLREAVSRRPAIVHIAAHVLERGPEGTQALLALSLDQEGRLQVVGPATIRAWGAAPCLVVLSGCNSGLGPALPGAGLLGFSRAWLVAGARAVIASLWPTPDDSGELFQAFYSHLKNWRGLGSRAPLLALQQAQRDMLASGNWRARPSYWAAYFIIGAH